MYEDSTTTTKDAETPPSEPVVEVVGHAGERARPSTAPKNGKPVYADTATVEEKEQLDDDELEERMDEETELWKAQSRIAELERQLHAKKQHEAGQMPEGVHQAMAMMHQGGMLPQGAQVNPALMQLIAQQQQAQLQLPPHAIPQAGAVHPNPALAQQMAAIALQSGADPAQAAAVMQAFSQPQPGAQPFIPEEDEEARERKARIERLDKLDMLIDGGDIKAIALECLSQIRSARCAIFIDPTPEIFGAALETLMLVESALDTELWMDADSAKERHPLKVVAHRVRALRNAIIESFGGNDTL